MIAKTKRRLRLWQLSLRTILIAVTAVCISLPWFLPSPPPAAKHQFRWGMGDEDQFVHVYIDKFNTFYVLTQDWEEEVATRKELIKTLWKALYDGPNRNDPTHLIIVPHAESDIQRYVTVYDVAVDLEVDFICISMTEDDGIFY